MKHLLDKNEILKQRLDSVHEQVFKMGDEYKVRTNISIPKTLVNKFVSKAKKEHDVDPKENWSDIELAQLFVDYILANYLNDESLPVEGILGKQDKEPGAVTDTVEAGTDEPIEETDEEVLDDVESVETTVETEDGDEISSEIQFENKDNTEETNESKVDKAGLIKNVKKLYNTYVKKGDSNIDKKKLDKIITKDMLDDKTGNVSNALDKLKIMDLEKAKSLLEEPSKKMLDK